MSQLGDLLQTANTDAEEVNQIHKKLANQQIWTTETQKESCKSQQI
jgi:hypothetical protein